MSVESAPEDAADPGLTVEEYFALADQGVLDPDERTELLEGVVVSMAPAGSRERPRFQRQAALVDIGEGRQDDRADERQDPADPCPHAALGVEASRALALRDDACPLDEAGDRLDGGHGDERESR